MADRRGHGYLAHAALQRIASSTVFSRLPRSCYPAISSIPPTSASRLAEATPARPVEAPIPSSSAATESLLPSASSASTVLYLAYGSNLCAETFLGRRGIRPVSQLNVSAPTLRLTFDLPGMPYSEPCFANTAPRKLPKLPPDVPKLPPDVPKLPPNVPGLPPPEGSRLATTTQYNVDVAQGNRTTSHGDPVWNKGLIGVVYEVTPEDYAHILATEGGGSTYLDVLVPCFEIPAAPGPHLGFPEKPAPPSKSLPFLAHMLYAPRLPGGDGGSDGDNTGVRDGDGDGETPEIPPWARKLLGPVYRPDPDYAQPSPRYLKLIRDGAREHGLPADYQAWLAVLGPYTRATRRQEIGQLVFMAVWGPLLVLLLAVGKLFAGDGGRPPLWLDMVMNVLFNLSWMSYDIALKPLCGDGERTEEAEEGRTPRRERSAYLSEKSRLLEGDSP